jgi:hypothetical protein
VRKYTALFFLTVLLLAQTPVQQLLRTPVLAVHFLEHRAENMQFSFAEYLSQHYLSNHPKDKDYDRDMQLPFRHKEVVLINSTVVVPALLVADFTPPVYQETPFCQFYVAPLTSITPSGIWQPPRFC